MSQGSQGPSGPGAGPPSASPVQMRILSDPVYLSVVRAAALRFCEAVGFDEKSAQAVALALDEALANVIRHGYEDRRDQPIHVDFQVRQPPGEARRELQICVRDFGRQVDAAQIVPRALEDIRPGGLGVHIMRSVMDRVEYRKRGLAGMELQMSKLQEDETETPSGRDT